MKQSLIAKVGDSNLIPVTSCRNDGRAASGAWKEKLPGVMLTTQCSRQVKDNLNLTPYPLGAYIAQQGYLYLLFYLKALVNKTETEKRLHCQFIAHGPSEITHISLVTSLTL